MKSIRKAVGILVASSIGLLIIFMIVAGAIGLAFVYGSILIFFLAYIFCQKGDCIKKGLVLVLTSLLFFIPANVEACTIMGGKEKKLTAPIVRPVHFFIREIGKQNRSFNL